ncbi:MULTISPECIES: hemolysin III family protein [Micromonospora]|uniref:Hemolysin III family protein n=1 Tax=Micromonospora solifontis TaxID=2487138 RepID=A0ABX9WBW9_9ACTN|nr:MULTISPECIES: hemolysin III family protein [Micromonospora]NES14499.1 hemolysin III family protein [Micromonospora sp. PPF5-17B]NES38651.1 hemolysin III family protein [Micromonospora solifontis]NES56430.1 hemolysin III family protein [Micromonospora sp. PPF5-6]RNL94038.1 hemolysin III family protein [Micromonospora solifontis]
MTTSAPLRLKPVDIGKPRMRGWLHTYAFFVALVCGIVLCSIAATRPGWAPLVSCLIYSLTVCGLFGTSALYHRRVWSQRGYQIMRRLDHSMIFLFIAGTYTPFCALLLKPRPAELMLGLVWGGALAGVAVKLIWPHAPRWVSAPLYLALGWVAVAMLPQILHGGGVTALVLLIIGGAIYSVGAVFYALRKPNPWPTVFGHHEFFHACTLVAAICHHIAIYFALFS